ncbi:DJ-1/PfpI family protein [Photobacterium lipolyticum]|uniref:DJ-1/PfpI family protein n=1 Tax=Photobacterium lipolyticum TaxID=266810 RepID=A0A2T3N2S9_9GAMM|nr:DJ-1/PfpI family protein [Photobacterium lipolyticum]PSW06641.1 DJ-1/PfpI family protein [Photobacterium lipolyticum]
MSSKLTVTTLLFNQFELLDAFGPLEMFGVLNNDYQLKLVSETGQPVASAQGPQIMVDHSFQDSFHSDILLIPGGIGTRVEVESLKVLSWLQKTAAQTQYLCSVCTGAALLANAGLLENRSATTNKKNYHWVTRFGNDVNWQPVARWVQDGDVFTSSGVAAGIDMTLALIGHLHGEEVARKVAIHAEYLWQNDPRDDPFAPLHIVR